jgi:hypothetical protein
MNCAPRREDSDAQSHKAQNYKAHDYEAHDHKAHNYEAQDLQDAQDYRALWVAIQRGETEEFERLLVQIHGNKACYDKEELFTELEMEHLLNVLVVNDQASFCEPVERLLGVKPEELFQRAAEAGAVATVQHLIKHVLQRPIWRSAAFDAIWPAIRHAHHGVVARLLHAKPAILRSGGGITFSGPWTIAQTVPPGAFVRTIVCLLQAKGTVNDGYSNNTNSHILGHAVTHFPPPSPRVIGCLLRAKANPDTQFVYMHVKCPVLAHAAAAGNVGTVNLLIKFKADVNRGPDEEKEGEAKRPTAKFCMENEEAKQRHGTPLQVATRLKQQDVVFALLSAGALPLNE